MSLKTFLTLGFGEQTWFVTLSEQIQFCSTNILINVVFPNKYLQFQGYKSVFLRTTSEAVQSKPLNSTGKSFGLR